MRLKSAFKKIMEKNNYKFIETNSYFKISLEGEKGRWRGYCNCIEEDSIFIFYSLYDFRVPSEKLNIVSEYINRLNYGMKVGNFEIDLNKGKVHFKTSFICSEDTCFQTLINDTLAINLMITDRYLSVFLKLIYSSLTPEEAIKLV